MSQMGWESGVDAATQVVRRDGRTTSTRATRRQSYLGNRPPAERTNTLAVNQFTNDFMKALPAPLRPNPYTVDEYVMKAVENGWETDALAKACYINDRKPNPAFVVTNLKSLCLHGPSQEYKRKGWGYGHVPCNDPWHGPQCEICRCIPNEETHHVSVGKSLPLPRGRDVEAD